MTGSAVSRSFLAESVRIIKQWVIKLFVLPSLFPPKLIAASAVQNEHEGLSCVFFLLGKMVCLMSHLCHVSASAQSSSCSTTFSTLLILAVLLCLPVGHHHLWSAALKLGEVLEMSVWRSAENKRVTYNFHGQCFSTEILYICKYIYMYLYTYISLSISLLLCKSVMLSESIQLMNHKNRFYAAAHLYFWSLPSDDEKLSLCDYLFWTVNGEEENSHAFLFLSSPATGGVLGVHQNLNSAVWAVVLFVL